MSFDVKWVTWIMLCVITITYSIMFNGYEVGLIVPNRALGQGDPLSLFFLFTVMDLECQTIKNVLSTFEATSSNGHQWKVHWASWDNLCVPKKYGGMLDMKPMALLSTDGWAWDRDLIEGLMAPYDVHRILLLMALLLEKGLAISLDCICCGELEDMEHVFFHCTRAIQVWQIVGVSVSQATITGFVEH
ncbi:hypothetical protein GOBAR_DD12541 [Gossypium barbadense]|nr:hypothetical protein GOBAR_DD12541 [Gossypium barbadense]